jgi:hypothetical protein
MSVLWVCLEWSLPLHVCYGITEQPAQLIFNDQILGKHNVASFVVKKKKNGEKK